MFWALGFFAFSAWAQPVATVTIEDFQPGRHWTWEYRAEDGALYSTERYTVISINGNEIVLEMSTAFPDSGRFEPHHRLSVPFNRCLAAYADPAFMKTWSFRMYYREGDAWREVEAPSTLAFEEKFNCNPHRHDSTEFETQFKNSPVGELFMHKRWRRIPGTWFMNDGLERGVAFEKIFSRSNGVGGYRMSLVYMGVGGQ